MRQVARRLKDGRLELVEVPDPALRPGTVAVRVTASVISAGTEGATLDVARKGLIAKARARPDQVRQVIDRARSEGVRSTLTLVRERLEALGPLGYSAAGEVVEASPEARRLRPGDRVAVAGGGVANHAEIDVVPSLLCARIPETVSDEDAAFTTLGAVALNAFRLADVGVGSTVTVIGLGLIGQLAVRVARAAGCRVIGIDLKPELVELATRAGAEPVLRSDVESDARLHESSDGVLICAAGSSADPIQVAASTLARDRAGIVVVGDLPMELPREPFYEKELELRVARSYGPGRYDPDYETHGLDYPIGHVRWTEQRNMEAFLDLVAQGAIDPSALVTDRFPFAEAERAFDQLQSDELTVGILLTYDGSASAPAEPEIRARPPGDMRKTGTKPRFGIIGAGSFATATLIPGLVKAGLEPAAIASESGLSAEGASRRFGFESHSGVEELISQPGLDLIVIATRHDSHAELAARALQSGCAVYVEKPLALDYEGLELVRQAQMRSGAPLIVGFNRRFAPMAAELRRLPGPRLMAYRVNAGRLSRTHWVHDLARGGGRLKGEGCHFIDFLRDQAQSDPVSVSAQGFPSYGDLPRAAADNFAVQLSFADGSIGTISYGADGPRGPGKERFEVSAQGSYAVIDDFRRGELWKGTSHSRLGGRGQQKGFAEQFSYLADLLQGRAEPPPVDEIYALTLGTLAAARSLETGVTERVIDQ